VEGAGQRGWARERARPPVRLDSGRPGRSGRPARLIGGPPMLAAAAAPCSGDRVRPEHLHADACVEPPRGPDPGPGSPRGLARESGGRGGAGGSRPGSAGPGCRAAVIGRSRSERQSRCRPPSRWEALGWVSPTRPASAARVRGTGPPGGPQPRPDPPGQRSWQRSCTGGGNRSRPAINPSRGGCEAAKPEAGAGAGAGCRCGCGCGSVRARDRACARALVRVRARVLVLVRARARLRLRLRLQVRVATVPVPAPAPAPAPAPTTAPATRVRVRGQRLPLFKGTGSNLPHPLCEVHSGRRLVCWVGSTGLVHNSDHPVAK
jgi:hypothetical protein